MRKLMAFTLAVAGAAGTARAEDASNPIAAVTAGDLILEARPRLETLDQQGLAEADAWTLRTRLGWKSASWRGFSGLIEIEDVRDLGGDYDDGIPPPEPFATIGDPQSTEVNRLQLAWRANDHFTATLGRQNIDFDDGRFVDLSNSRQDSRTYDAARGDVAFGGLNATYAFVTQVNNTTADFNDWEGETHLLNATQAFAPAFNLTAFVYALDFDTPVAVNLSTRFLGVRAEGRLEARGAQFDYVASHASQHDYGHSTLTYDLDYWHALVSATHGEWFVRLWWESLEGDGAIGFFVPIGSTNNFQGWAGAFNVKPPDGVVDTNLTLAYTPQWAPDFLGDLEFMIRGYQFEAERTGADFGDEFDASISADLSEHVSVAIEYGDYDPGDPGSPAARTRTRIYLQYRF
jgi:hypothetical protein